MTMRSRRLQIHTLLLAGIVFCVGGWPVRAEKMGDLSAFVGRWKIDLNRTQMNRGNHITRSNTFTFIFEPSETGLTMHTYAQYPQAAPDRSNPIIPDQKIRTCETRTGCLTIGGNPAEQSYAYYQIDSHLLMRAFYIKSAVTEYSTYSVSADGKTFTMIAWGAESPDKQNIQVFDRQSDAAVDKSGLYRPHSVDRFMSEVDTNHDGLASEAEWRAAGLKMDSFLAIQWLTTVFLSFGWSTIRFLPKLWIPMAALPWRA